MKNPDSGYFQHDASAVSSDKGLSSQLKSAAESALKKMAGESVDEVPVLMSGAGHDAMAMSHLTKVCSFAASLVFRSVPFLPKQTYNHQMRYHVK